MTRHENSRPSEFLFGRTAVAAFSFDEAVRAHLLELGIPDAAHLLELLQALKGPVLLPVVQNGLRQNRAHAGNVLQLLEIRLIDIDEKLPLELLRLLTVVNKPGVRFRLCAPVFRLEKAVRQAKGRQA